MRMGSGKGLSLKRNSSFMHLEDTRSPFTVEMAESRIKSSGEQMETLYVVERSGPWCSTAIGSLANGMASSLPKSPSP